jgi:pyruvate dehydrogenase E2 component (dihydrolipoamide acetyltransferase)
LATRMIMPLLGQTMEEGTITKWLKQEGEAVVKGQPLLEVMTDKANMEVEAPASGVLLKIVAPVDAIVPVKDLIAIIGEAGESIGDIASASGPASTSSGTPSVSISGPQMVEPTTAGTGEERLFTSPRARKVAADHGIDIAQLAGKGTGPGGRIVEKDVLAFASQASSAPRVTPLAGKIAADIGIDVSLITGSGRGGKVTRDDVVRATSTPRQERPSIGRTIPFSGMRKAVAENVSRSIRTSPHVTLVSEVDVTQATALREQLLAEMQKRYGIKLTFTALLVKAAAMAILDYPIINSSLIEDKIVIHEDINIGMAVALESGLIVPVIRNADTKLLQEISNDIAVLAAKARAGTLSTEEMHGGTFTITNLGAYGVDSFNPIINPPECAILGVGRSAEKPVFINGQVQARTLMNLCLSFDHRVVDGAPAAQYLAKVKEILESPYLLML